MRPLFTVHAGEYLVGAHIQQTHPQWQVWLPAKDTGIDLLVTDARNRRAVSLQVKYSKDFNPTQPLLLQRRLRAVGWWTHKPRKIASSPADFWIFVLPSFTEPKISFIIVPPAELVRKFRLTHGRAAKRIDSYLWVTGKQRCWETRGLPTADQHRIAFDEFSDRARDFSDYLNAWQQITRKLR